MRGFWVGAGVASLLVTGLTAPPATAAAPAADTTVQAVTPGPNPTISETCGLDATLILDASGSIKSAGAVNTVRNASYDLLAALKDTNSTLRVTQFGTFSGQLSSRVDVNASTVGTGGQLSQAVAKYYTPPAAQARRSHDLQRQQGGQRRPHLDQLGERDQGHRSS